MAGSPRFHTQLNFIRALHDGKSADYGSTDDAFANFRTAEWLGVSAVQVCLIRLGEKWKRAQNVLAKGDENRAVADEPVLNTLQDIASLALIAICLLQEAQEAAERDLPQQAQPAPLNVSEQPFRTEIADPKIDPLAWWENGPVRGWRPILPNTAVRS